MEKDNDILMDGIDERIEAFLRGTMTAEEEDAFKQEVKSNPELRNRAMAMTAMLKGLRVQNSAREHAIIKKNTKDRLRPALGWACSIAAVFALFFGYQTDKRYHQLSEVIAPYYASYDADDISRGDTDPATVIHLYDLFNQIQKQRYVSNVIKELEPIYTSLDADFTYAPYANDIAWNLALAYIKNDQADKAIPVLEKLIADNPDMPIAAKAEKLLKEFPSLK
jgi:hypothetical protein